MGRQNHRMLPAKRAGIGKQVYPHMLRHTMATTLLANGCPIGHIRALPGHEHLTTTCKYYLGIIAERTSRQLMRNIFRMTSIRGRKQMENSQGKKTSTRNR